MTIHEQVLDRLARVCDKVSITFSKDWGHYTSSVYWVPENSDTEEHAHIGSDDYTLSNGDRLLQFCEDLNRVLDKIEKGLLDK